MDKKSIEGFVDRLMGPVTKKLISEVKDKTVREYLGKAWGELEMKLPDLVHSLVQPAETVLVAENAKLAAEILAKMAADLESLRTGKITQLDYPKLVERRKLALNALYCANASQAKPSLKKVIMAVAAIAKTLVEVGIPYVLKLKG
jgi:hypothetical protein